MIVRPAVEADIPVLGRIAAASYADAFATILEPAILAARDATSFADRFAEWWPATSVAEQDGRVLGFAKVTGAHLDMLFVDPAAQNTGAGSALLAHVETKGVRTLECFRDNAPARRFYERKGWRLTRAYEREFLGRMRAFVFYERNWGDLPGCTGSPTAGP